MGTSTWPHPQQEFRVLLVGDREVGKTALLHRLKGHVFTDTYQCWHYDDGETKTFTFPTTQGAMKFTVVDVSPIGGSMDWQIEQMRFSHDYLNLPRKTTASGSVVSKYIYPKEKPFDAAIIMFDGTDRRTYRNLRYWRRLLRARCGKIPLTVVQNKTDCMDQRDREWDQPGNRSWRKFKKIGYHRISVKEDTNVVDPFMNIARYLTGDDSLQLLGGRDLLWRALPHMLAFEHDVTTDNKNRIIANGREIIRELPPEKLARFRDDPIAPNLSPTGIKAILIKDLCDDPPQWLMLKTTAKLFQELRWL